MRKKSFDEETWQELYKEEKLPTNFSYQRRRRILNKMWAHWIPFYVNRIKHYDKITFIEQCKIGLLFKNQWNMNTYVERLNVKKLVIPVQHVKSLEIFILKKKNWTNWKSVVLHPSENWGPKAICCLENERSRQTDIENFSLKGAEGLSWTSSSLKLQEGPILETPHSWEFHLQKPYCYPKGVPSRPPERVLRSCATKNSRQVHKVKTSLLEK